MRQSMDKEIIEMGRRQAEIAVAFQQRVAERLACLAAESLTPEQLIAWFVQAVKVERIARGLPEEVAAIRGTHELVSPTAPADSPTMLVRREGLAVPSFAAQAGCAVD
jgi:hypothetical protein